MMTHPTITTEPAAPLWPTGSDIEVKVRRVTAIEVGAIEHSTVDHPIRPGEALDYYHRLIRLRDDRGGELRLDLHAWTERALYMATQHDVADLGGELAAAKTERDEARAQAAELAEQVDELRAENIRLQASVGALCAEVAAEGEEHAKTIARETCLAPPPERKPLGLRAGPAMLTTPEWADQIVEPTDRRVPLHPDRGRV